MGKIERWSNVSGQYSFDCSFDKGILFDSDGDELPSYMADNIKELFPVFVEEDTVFQVIINFLSEGYYDPGRIYGDPEFCYPPEGDDIRTLDGLITVDYLPSRQEDYATKELTKQQSDKWFNHFSYEIQKVELDASMDDGDYDRYDDVD